MKLKPFPKFKWLLLTGTLLLLAACTPQPTTDAPAETAADNSSTEAAVSNEAEVNETAASDSAAAPVIDPSRYDQYEIITLLPPDAIPAIDNPQFLTAAEASDEYEPDELVLGVFINGEARAYSVPHLSSHEIVNDTVGGRKISVTW